MRYPALLTLITQFALGLTSSPALAGAGGSSGASSESWFPTQGGRQISVEQIKELQNKCLADFVKTQIKTIVNDPKLSCVIDKMKQEKGTKWSWDPLPKLAAGFGIEYHGWVNRFDTSDCFDESDLGFDESFYFQFRTMRISETRYKSTGIDLDIKLGKFFRARAYLVEKDKRELLYPRLTYDVSKSCTESDALGSCVGYELAVENLEIVNAGNLFDGSEVLVNIDNGIDPGYRLDFRPLRDCLSTGIQNLSN